MPGIVRAVGRVIRHGQLLCIYPSAFESQDDRVSNYSFPTNLSREDVTLTTSDKIILRCYLLHATTPTTSTSAGRGNSNSNSNSNKEKENAKRESLQSCTSTPPTPPTPSIGVPGPHTQAHAAHDHHIRTAHAHAARSRATVIMFHGNGYHVWHHGYSAQQFVRMGCDVLLVSYRGYGNSTGRPSEKGLRKDAQAALDYVLSHPRLSRSPIVLHGHSLGGAVAIDLASRNPGKINALIIENTFLSIPLVVRDIPGLKHLSPFVHQRWNSERRIGMVGRDVGILMISGKRDEVVFERHMVRLWEVARGRGGGADGGAEGEGGRGKRKSLVGERGSERGRRSRRKVEGHEDTETDTSKSPNRNRNRNIDMWKSIPDGSHSDTWTKSGYWSTVNTFLQNVELGFGEGSREVSRE